MNRPKMTDPCATCGGEFGSHYTTYDGQTSGCIVRAGALPALKFTDGPQPRECTGFAIVYVPRKSRAAAAL
jgi:hypothetical protein